MTGFTDATFPSLVATSAWEGWAASAVGAALLAVAALCGLLLWSRVLRAEVRRRSHALAVSIEQQAAQSRALARTQEDATIRARQQAVIAALGQRALAGIDLTLLIDQATTMVAETLRVDAVGVLETGAAGRSLRLRGGPGWESAVHGSTELRVEPGLYPCTVLTTAAPFVIQGGADDAARLHPFLAGEAIAASAAAAIPGHPQPYGVLLAAQRSDRTFSRDDLHFLQAIANVIGASYERMVIDSELRAALALQHATLESTAEGVLVTDAAGRVTCFNQRLVKMWGYPPEVLASDAADDWIRFGATLCDEPERRLAELRPAGAGEQVDRAIVTLRDGRVFERHSQPQRLDGRVAGHVLCYRDITDRVRAEEESRQLEAQMQHVQKLESLGVLAGGIAHDFNNLLVGILGNAGLALLDAPAGSPMRDRIEHIATAAQRAAELTNQMLAYSGRGPFIRRRSDLSHVVGEMATLLRSAVTRNAQLDLSLAPDLPPFEGDPAQIRQVVMNLITNAADAIGEGSGTIRVTTSVCAVTRASLADAVVGRDVPEGTFVVVEVSDDGAGMDQATLARIFEPFFTTKFTGRGLGLAAVLGIVRGHGGAIKVASTQRQGTTFRMLLPAVTAAPMAEPVRRVAPAASPAGGRMLVVDDEPGVRRVASEILRRGGFDVTDAKSGEEAVELVRAGARFDAVLLDVTMPRMNGIDTFKALQQVCPGLCVVLTSGYSQQDTSARFDTGGVAGFIQKPFAPAALTRAMREAMIDVGPGITA